jgi:two-component system nitrate/nitrite response regulator NarL
MNSILIADPDSASRKALALLLTRKHGITTYCEAGDVDTLIRQLVDEQPDLLILDWKMYGAPAPETCRLLRKAYPSMKILLLSVDVEDNLMAQECGASFIHKGASPDEVVSVLESILKID